MCFSKHNGKLIDECGFIDNAINNICASLSDRETMPISFTSLKRDFMIERVGRQLIIKDTTYRR
jgi:thymidine kinase